jgi:fructose/tagatose bisphosphate aldolase
MDERVFQDRELGRLAETFRRGVEKKGDGTWRVRDASLLRGAAWDRLAYAAVFAPSPEERRAVRSFLRGAARGAGTWSASIHPLYRAVGEGKAGGFTVPAMNLRGLTYDTARAAFRAAKARDAGALVFEIARTEIGYTEQRPDEYAVLVLAAAVREGFAGPVFLQGDHFQVNAARFEKEREKEMQGLRDLIEEALAASFRNIDIDSSTLVDLSRPDVLEQQRLNYEVAAELTRHVRLREGPGDPAALGGEIGEVGGKNSTPEELRAFMDGYRGALRRTGGGIEGIGKISVQTGTTHGGVPLPDGRVAEVNLDLDALEALSRVAREEYGLAGAVQHGASTLPEEAFGHFPERGCVEIHLATGFQNMVLESPHLPAGLRREMEAHLEEAHGDERKEGQTREAARDRIAAELEERFAFLFETLRITGTRGLVNEHVRESGTGPQEALPAPFAPAG